MTSITNWCDGAAGSADCRFPSTYTSKWLPSLLDSFWNHSDLLVNAYNNSLEVLTNVVGNWSLMTKVCHNFDVVGKCERFQCVIYNIESFDNVVPEDIND